MRTTAQSSAGAERAARREQFRYLNRLATERLDAREPVISVDTGRREIDDEPAGGVGWAADGSARLDRGHLAGVPASIPFGVHDSRVGGRWEPVEDEDDDGAAALAVDAVRRWWRTMGAERHPAAGRLLVAARIARPDLPRARLLTAGLAALATEAGLRITVCHYPPGTSKWSVVEQRLFRFSAVGRRGGRWTSYRIVVEAPAASVQPAVPRLHAEHEDGVDAEDVGVSDELADVPLAGHPWRPDWNYDIAP